MKVLYFDCFSGISGDMTVGSLLDLGAGEEALRSELSKLNLEGYEIKIEKKLKKGIMGTSFNVVLHDEDHSHHDSMHVHDSHNHHYDNEHIHEHHNHHHDEHFYEENHHHNDEHSHEEHHHNHRNLKDIEEIIDKSSLKDNVKSISKKIFKIVAQAEGKIHGMAPEDVHFHEVGALDSIVDIVGTAICIDQLKPEKIVFSKLPISRGFVNCQHGIFPLPAPATMEIVKGIPLYFTDAPIELVTPTGAAIVKALGNEFGDFDSMAVDKIGYGVGNADYEIPNVLRTILFNIKKKQNDTVVLLETNVDDMTGEALGYTMEKLFNAGALDVYFTPIIMKKNRPGVILSALCSIDGAEDIKNLIFHETSTFGIREKIINRDTLDREFLSVEVHGHNIRCKVGLHNGKAIKYQPEYEDCKSAALNTGFSFEEIYRYAQIMVEKIKNKSFDK